MGNDLDVDAVVELYNSCSLGARRPVDDRQRMAAMLANANLVITAWDGELLVGISRSLTDFAYATYLSDLAVRERYQKLGIGRELIRRTQQAGGARTRVILLSAPAAVDYYPRIGFTRHPSAWTILGSEPLKP
jgi:ribosomal protein S18 acetylase RimI-like enzyme